MLDGDDWLSEDFALEALAEEYKEGWEVVWANWRGSDGSRGGCGHLNPFVSPRFQPFVTSHLFSFKKKLFDAITAEDLARRARRLDSSILRSGNRLAGP